ncbi:MAG TPA: P-loop domain-containing protein [Kiritimatiellia bacterium]|jgi:predicted ABC-class ATPase
MKDKDEFYRLISEIDGRESAEYTRLIGDFDFGRYILKINRVPQDGEGISPLFLVRVPQSVSSFPPHVFNTPVRRTALEDFLTRRIAAWIDANLRFDGQGLARRRLSIAVPGQKILPRTALIVTDEYIEARLTVQLPSLHGRIDGAAARDAFFDDMPRLVNDTLLCCNLPYEDVEQFVDAMEDADQVRQILPTRGLVSFIAEGALLGRRGSTDLPDYAQNVPLQVDDGCNAEMSLPHAGAIRGLGIPAGVTVIIGDDYSGRIEVLRAIAAGIYNHVPGDGRELAITQPDAVYVTSSPGRSVQRVDIGAFAPSHIHHVAANAYTSACADAFASQAAAVVEAIDVGARALLLDEASSAASFMATGIPSPWAAGDAAMVSMAGRARQLADDLGLSIVVGANATAPAWITVADRVFHVKDLRVRDVTKEAKDGAIAAPAAPPYDFQALVERSRWVVPSSIDPSSGRFDSHVAAVSKTSLAFGRATIDLEGVEQLADDSQTTTIGLVMNYGKSRYLDEDRPLRELLDLIDRDLSTEGLEVLTRDMRGDLARPRRYEIAAALNRLRTLRIARGTAG